MPQFDLRGIKVANYVNTNGTITYTSATSIGDAMNVNLELRFAEGRLYAESTLAEFMRNCTGGTISKDKPKAVGVAFYAPDMVDGVKKFTCVKVARALFGNPSMTLQTAGENIVFNTPTTSGEFLADDSTNQEMLEVALCDTEADAIAWVTAVLA